jgi:hypothetical protein
MSHVSLTTVLATVTLFVGLAAPAHAEFFGCNDRHSQVLYQGSWNSGGSRYTHDPRDYSAQPRHAAHTRVTYSSTRRYYESRYR